MSVLIKGAKMPKNCSECFYLNDCKPFDERNSTEQAIRLFALKGRDPNCPLVGIPPYGRLIDADKLENIFWDILNKPEEYDKPLHDMILELQAAPTVIESEEE